MKIDRNEPLSMNKVPACLITDDGDTYASVMTLVELIGKELQKVNIGQWGLRYNQIVHDMDETFQRAFEKDQFPNLVSLDGNLRQRDSSGDADTYAKLQKIAAGVMYAEGYESIMMKPYDLCNYVFPQVAVFKTGVAQPDLLSKQAYKLYENGQAIVFNPWPDYIETKDTSYTKIKRNFR